MKLLNISVDGLPLFKDGMDVDFFAVQNVREINKDKLNYLFGNSYVQIYTNNVISFIGINASGKTSTLKALSFVISLLNGMSINQIEDKRIIEGAEKVLVEAVLYDEKETLYKTHTQIIIDKSSLLDTRYVISEEYILKKDISSVKSKKTLLEFKDVFKQRDNNSEFLKDDVSIVMSLTKNNRIFSESLIHYTNVNIPKVISEFPVEFLRFLDPSIERISFDETEKNCILKFFGREEISISNPMQLENYLSSGTIKGLNVLFFATMAFKTGGYLIVDELENHFNKEIICSLLGFFTNNNVNGRGATLIFSTHYIEIIDELERNDSIYVVKNNAGIYVQNLNNILKRNDLKKSEAFSSDYLDGTAPSYDSYIQLKHFMKKQGVVDL